MASNPYVNKVDLADGTSLIDISDSTAVAADVAAGKYFYLATGEKKSGTYVAPSAGTEGTPVATISAVENHAVTVTPSVTNVGGVITGGTHTGTAVSVSASELVSGTYTFSASGTQDVTNYQYAEVPAGTAGTPVLDRVSLTNGVYVSTHVTNTAGLISGGVKFGPDAYIYASDLVSGTYNVDSSGTKDVTNYQYASIPAGTAGTPTATKSAVSNHSVTVTPSVTNSAGFISSGTVNGTAVSVSASELVSGNLAITENGTDIDVTNYETVSVAVEGGGEQSIIVRNRTGGLSSRGSSVDWWFSDIPAGYVPIAFYVYATDTITPTSSYNTIATVVYDGTTTHGQIITNTNNAQVTYDSSGFSWQWDDSNPSSKGLTITSTSAVFDPIYDFTFIFGTSSQSSKVHTQNVQVGSGATSISFANIPFQQSELLDNMFVFFKSNFGTSSGYARAIAVEADFAENDCYGLEMTNAANFRSGYWTASFTNGTLTLTSNSASQGGYFHQPGNYELVYIEKVEGPITPEGTYSITQNGTYNVREYAYASVSVSGGATPPTPWQDTTGGTTTSTTATAIGSSFTVETAGTYRFNVFGWRSNTSGTWSLALYKNGTAITNGGATWNGNRGVCSVAVACAANDVISVRGQSRGTSYTLTLIGWTAAFVSS